MACCVDICHVMAKQLKIKDEYIIYLSNYQKFEMLWCLRSQILQLNHQTINPNVVETKLTIIHSQGSVTWRVLEIKCPYSVRDGLPTDVAYLTKTNDCYSLSWENNYYYQVQGQMGILERTYCDFVCWNPKDIFIELLMKCSTQIWNQIRLIFFILPLLISGNNRVQVHPSEEEVIFCKRWIWWYGDVWWAVL